MVNKKSTSFSSSIFEKPLIIDFIFYLVVLTCFYFMFYSKWGFWEDHAIFHYMAWGMQNRMAPYVDLVNNNFPGIIFIHVIGRILSGSSLQGIRFLDVVFIFVLCFYSSIILLHFGVQWFLRLLCMSSFLLVYFYAGHTHTAQRESFAFAPVIAGLSLFFTSYKKPEVKFKYIAWVFAGALSGFGLWIKPTPVISVIFLLLVFFLIDESKKEFLFKKLLPYFSGLCLISGLFFYGSFVKEA